MADDRSSKDSDKLSPLERYLAKQKAEKAALAAKTAPPAVKSRLAKLAASKTEPAKAAAAKPEAPTPAANALGKKAAYAPNERPTLNGIQRPEPLQPPSLSRWESVAENRLSETEQRALEAGAPAAPPRVDPAAASRAAPASASKAAPAASQREPPPEQPRAYEDFIQPITDTSLQPDGKINADFGPRFIAAIIDGCVLMALSFVAKRIVFAVLSIAFGSIAESHHDGLDYLTTLCMTYAYYGYFYPVKGASPGKLMLGLEIYDTDGVTRLTPWKAFFREAIGKVISAVPFMMGYIIVLIRGDHRALHDLLFDTRVIRKPGPGL